MCEIANTAPESVDVTTDGVEIETSNHVAEREGRNLASDFLEIPEIKCTVEFFKSRILEIQASPNCAFIRKLELKRVGTDYKKLEILCKRMFASYEIRKKHPDNDRVADDFENIIAEITDHVQGCLVRYRIQVIKPDADAQL